ncbi:MAG TPA: LysR family transcriptional regulator [Xanthobacteraceae bacterium]|nr:LysR family transcriptional regulator [Xanthobacteraceae bacterium]
MSKLPDLEGLAIFAKVAETRSFAGAAAELKLSKATVSKAISRVERKLKTRLFNRTSRRIALTDAGRQFAGRAAHILAEGEAVEDAALAQATVPRGLVRLAAPMSFGVLHVAPLLPEFLATYPEVSVDLHLSDAMVDLIGEGFDAAIRIASLPDSSLVVRRLCEMQRYLVGSPAYLKKHGRPRHPLHVAEHRCIGYSYTMTAESWRFARDGKSATVRPSGPLRVNNGDAMLPALIAGTGLGILPEFILREALAAGRLERLLPDWSLPLGAVYWVTPPGGPRPKRVEVLADFLVEKLSRQKKRGARELHTSVLRPASKAKWQ